MIHFHVITSDRFFPVNGAIETHTHTKYTCTIPSPPLMINTYPGYILVVIQRLHNQAPTSREFNKSYTSAGFLVYLAL